MLNTQYVVECLKSGELTPVDVANDVRGTETREKEVIKQFSALSIDNILDMGREVAEMLLFLNPGRHMREDLKEGLDTRFGEYSARRFEEAWRIAWQGLRMDSNFGVVREVSDLLDEYSACDLRVGELNDCRSVDQMREKLGLLTKLSGGDLTKFYTRGVDMFDIGEYRVRMHPGTYETIGGIDLHLYKGDMPLLKVGGKVTRHLDIRNIQGREGKVSELHEFKNSTGVHPALFQLLTYMKMGNHLEYDKTTIYGHASGVGNHMDNNSAFYKIPRNYFRLRANEHGNYEFNAEKRDKLLDKFSKKYEVVAQGLNAMDRFLSQ